MTVAAPDTPREAASREKPRESKAVFPLKDLKLEEPTNDGRRRIEGYAAAFGNRDSYGDIILPGAFERSLRERPDVKVLWQHDPRQAIGKQEMAVEDEFGLAVVGVLTNTDLVTGTVVPLLLDEVITGLSIGYNVLEEDYDSDLEAWLLKDIELFEWSPVTFPANELAGVSQVKELDSRREVNAGRVERHAKSLLHLLGDGGFFAKEKSDRRKALDFDLLDQLGTLLGGGRQGSSVPLAVHAKAIEAAEARGGLAALAALDEPTKED
jgi:Escherichia/Staphylococcus phage prohead protease